MDIIDRIRRVETTPLHGTEAWVELWEVLQDARAEITSMLDAGDRLESQLCEAAKERDSLRLAIRRLAEQDATLSLLCKRDGSQVVTVTIDATLTDAERAVLQTLRDNYSQCEDDKMFLKVAATLRGLLERLGGGE